MLEFAQPQWLWIGAVACCVAIALLVRADRKRRAAIARFAAASPETSVARRRRMLRHALVVAGLAMASVAMARPIAGFHWEQQPEQRVDIVFAVDTSKSMLAADVRPDRLTRAKLAVTDLARTLDGDRLGLVAFAGNAFVQAPMTVDRGVFLEAADALDTTIIPRGGSDLASAIRAAEQAMRSEPGHRKVLVMLSDGEDLAGNVRDAARDAAKRGVAIYTVGVGTRQGELIQTIDETGRPELVRDERGEPVRSKLDEATLRSVAQLTGGAYASLGADGRGLEAIVAAARADLPASTAEGTPRKIYVERYQIPLAFALGCLLVELVLGDRRRRRRNGTRGAALAMGTALLVVPQIASAEPASTAVSSYNRSTETYRRGEFEAAGRDLEAALRTDDVGLQVDAYYNLGNARYRIGQATLAKQDRDATIATWRRALQAYDAALALAPNDADAKFNRDFVAKKLAELELDQTQQNQSGSKDQHNQQSGSGQDQQQGQTGRGQQQPQSGEGQQQDQGGKQNQPGQGEGQQQDRSEQGKHQNPSGQGEGRQQDRSEQGKQQNPPGQGEGQHRDRSDQGTQQSQSAQEQSGQGKQTDQSDRRNQTGQQSNQAGSQPDRAKPQPDHQDRGQPEAPDPADRRQGSGAPRARGATGAEKQPDANQHAADAARRAAGQLTHTEAVQLLDSIADELRPLPIDGGKPNQTEDHIKDW